MKLIDEILFVFFVITVCLGLVTWQINLRTESLRAELERVIERQKIQDVRLSILKKHQIYCDKKELSYVR